MTLLVLNVSLWSFQGLITLQKTSTLWNRTGVFSVLCHGARALAADVLSKMSGGCALKVSPLDGGTFEGGEEFQGRWMGRFVHF